MKINIYCDETLPDLFTTKNPVTKKLMIGSLWIESNLLKTIKTDIRTLREKYNCWGEIKWTKVSPSKSDFYLELIDLFFSYGMQMRFRCICINPKQVDWTYHNGDRELGFYKFYYFLLKQWISNFNEYSIYCDAKVNRDLSRLGTLQTILQTTNITANIKHTQALPSKEVVLIQLTDFLLGAASSSINNIYHSSRAKIEVIKTIEKRLGHSISPTKASENKFNVFDIRLGGSL